MSVVKVEAVCESCGGTGLYVGFAEPEGAAAVCWGCGGSGCEVIRYKPWSGKRRGRRGILTVRGPWRRGTSVTYAEFRTGKLPKEEER